MSSKYSTLKLRRGTASEWSAANPVVLASGEPGFIVDTNTLKIGDGSTTFASLTAVAGGGGGISNILEDTTPQLGGNLDLNSKDLTGTGDVIITGSGNFTQGVFLNGATAVKSDTTGISNSSGVVNLVKITQANYNALGSYDANTVYFIV